MAEPIAEERKQTPPPNPHCKRYYRHSCDVGGAMEISIPAPGNKLPPDPDASEMIEFLQLIIRQIERARDKSALLQRTQEHPDAS